MASALLWDDKAHWSIESAREMTLRQGQEAMRHAKPYALYLLIPQEGSFGVQVDGERVPLFGSLMLLVDGGRGCSLYAISAEPKLMLIEFATVRGSQAGQTLGELYEKYAAYRRFSRSDAPYELFDDSYALIATTSRAIKTLEGFDEDERRSLNRLYATYMILVITCETEISLRFRGTGNRIVRRAQQYLHSHCTVPVTIQEVARDAGVHPAYLQRLFRKETGMPVHAYLRAQRMARVRFLLMHTAFSIAQIARMSGMGTQAYLTRAFRAVYGQTPGEFRACYNTTCFYDNMPYSEQVLTEDIWNEKPV